MNQGTVEPPGAQQGAVRGGLRGSRRGGWRGNRGRGGPPKTQREPKDRPTHFISIPLDQIRPFTSQVDSMTGALLAASPPISGLDRSIVISPACLHLTLGVMALKESPSVSTDQPPGGETTRDESSTRSKTVSDAAEFLQQLKPLVRQVMNDQPIQLTLDELAVMRRSPEGDADVMYLGPSSITPKSEEHNRSVSLLQTIHERFRQAGFVTETRPLKLHCTVLNTSQRRSGNRSGPRGVPFSIFQIEQTIDRNPSITGDLLPSPSPLLIRELHICRMGSYDESGRYVRVASMVW